MDVADGPSVAVSGSGAAEKNPLWTGGRVVHGSTGHRVTGRASAERMQWHWARGAAESGGGHGGGVGWRPGRRRGRSPRRPGPGRVTAGTCRAGARAARGWGTASPSSGAAGRTAAVGRGCPPAQTPSRYVRDGPFVPDGAHRSLSFGTLAKGVLAGGAPAHPRRLAAVPAAP